MGDSPGPQEWKGRIAARLAEAAVQAARFNTLDASRACLDALSLARARRAELGAAAEPLAAEALVALGELDEAAGRLADALARFDEAQRIAARHDHSALAARALAGTGQVLLHRRDLPGALAALEAAREAARRGGNEELALRVKILLAHALSLDGRHGEADESLAAAFSRLKGKIAAGVDGAEVRELCCTAGARLAIGSMRRRLPAEAEELLREALHAVEPLEHSVAKAEALRYLGVARSGKGAFVEAVDHYARALAILKYCYHAPSLARLYASIGRTWLAAGDLAQAQSNFAKARSLCLKLDLSSNVAEFTSMLGHIAYRRGEYAEARRLYEEDLAITAGLSDRLALGYAHRNLAAACIRLADPAAASAQLDEADRLFREAKSDHNLAHVLLLRGELYAGRGYSDGARDAADEAERIFHALERRAELGLVELLRGRIDAACGDGPAALIHLARSVSLLREAREPFDMLDACEALAETAATLGRKDLALRAWSDAAKIAERHRLARVGERIAAAVERLDEAGGMGLSARRLAVAARVERAEEKEAAVSLAVAADAAALAILAFHGLEALAASAGVARAEAVASRIAAAAERALSRAGARPVFHTGFTVGLLAAPSEGGDPVETLAALVRAAAEAAAESGRILMEELGADAGLLPVALLCDLAPPGILAFGGDDGRESFPVSERARRLLSLALAQSPAPGVSVHLADEAARHLAARGDFSLGDPVSPLLPLHRLLAVR